MGAKCVGSTMAFFFHTAESHWLEFLRVRACFAAVGFCAHPGGELGSSPKAKSLNVTPKRSVYPRSHSKLSINDQAKYAFVRRGRRAGGGGEQGRRRAGGQGPTTDKDKG